MTSNSANLIVDFVNTYDVESEQDGLDRPATLSRWFAERALPHGDATERTLDQGRALRESLRTLLRANHDGEPAAPADLEELAAGFPLRVRLAGGTPELAAAATGTAAGLALVLAACVQSAAEGTWSRLKVCGEDTCQWAFYDTTRNHSRAWCSMRVCGNRAKTRSYRERRRGD